MTSDRKELIAEPRRLAAMTTDAERERTLLILVERLEAGDKVGRLEHLLPNSDR